MIRKASFPILLAILVAGCAINDQRVGLRPQDRLSPEKARSAEYRAMAESVVRGKAKDGRLNYINPNARIKLQPTPGYETIHEKGHEVLTSRESGGYFAFTDSVPITQYFRILRRADCDDWGVNLPIKEYNFRMQPQFYLQSDMYQGDKPQYACLSAFDDYYLKSDPRLIGADGVLFDIHTLSIDEKAFHWTLVSQKVKVHMDGWAIQFGEPSAEETGKALNVERVPSDPIELLQFKTVVYWIQKNRAVQYVPQLLSLLPTNRRDAAGWIWKPVDEFVLQTIARIAAPDIANEEWMRIIEVGENPSIHPKYPIPGNSGIAPEIAANVLICKGDRTTDLIPRLVAVLSGHYPRQNKHAAAVALRSLGRSDLVNQQLINPSHDLNLALSGDSTYKCPYSSTHDAI